MLYSSDILALIKSRNPIEAVMGQTVALKRAGRDFKCCCPFHSEKTPSCVVRPEEQYFHCFGCGAGGDVFNFVMRRDGLTYPEAIRELASRSGIDLPDYQNGENFANAPARTDIFAANREAAKFYYETLINSPLAEKGRRYFNERGLSPVTVKKFGLGFALNQWDALSKFLLGKGHTEEVLIAAQLCRNGKNGGLYDFFRDRVMFPIIDTRGNVIGFGGRIIDTDGPKYINTPETPVFHKGKSLFAHNFARKTTADELILAEGYMDVIALHQAGFDNAVATLGTALTPDSAREIVRTREQVVIAYDADAAGQAAAEKAIKLLSAAGGRTRILKTVDAKDPDEYIKKFGADKFRQLIRNSENAVTFKLKQCENGLDLDVPAEKAEYIKRAAKVLAQIDSDIEREIYINEVAKQTLIPIDSIKHEAAKNIKKTENTRESREWNDLVTKTALNSNTGSKEERAENAVFEFLLKNPEKTQEMAQRICSDDFVSEFGKVVFEKLTEISKNYVDFDISLLLAELSPEFSDKIITIYENSNMTQRNEAEAYEFADRLKNSKIPQNEDEFLKAFNL
ncbi:MAG: DNA primase [Ruminococcus sp.]|jgi:DNA primase|nr:DNA primase [Ruminococcus sp.]